MRDHIREFERYLKRRYPTSSTAEHYVNDLRIAHCLIDKPPDEVRSRDIDAFIEDQLAEGLAATTINRRLSSLHHFFEFLAHETDDDDWSNPVVWQFHRVAEPKHLPRDVKERDLERLFAQIDHPRDRLMFSLMVLAGLRVGEVAALRVEDFIPSPHRGQARLRVRGKGNKERVVPLAPALVHLWRAWSHERPSVQSNAVFVTRRKRGISVRGIQDRLTHYARRAGIRVSCHQLRHTFGRRMAEGHMPLPSLSKMMGHAHVDTTQRYIAGAAVDVQADYQVAMGRLAAECQGSSPSPAASGASRGAETKHQASVSHHQTTRPPATRTVEEPIDWACLWSGLPPWLIEPLTTYLQHCRGRWKPSQRDHHTRARSYALRQIWRWLIDEREITELASVRRSDLQAYIDARLELGRAVSTINRELRDMWAFLRFLVARDHPIAPDVFRIPRLKEGARLPRFLTEAEYQRLKARVLEGTATGTRDDRLDRAIFYVLAHGGLRLGELCDLSVSDVDLIRRRLMVREGKGKKDRSVPLSEPSVLALRAYLDVREPALTEHLFVFRERMINPDLVRRRLRHYGEDVGVNVSPHRLRHTLATRLVNVGMDIVSIRNLLGHEKLSTTMVYAWMHDATVTCHFREAIARLESSAHHPFITGPGDREVHSSAPLCLPVSISNCV